MPITINDIKKLPLKAKIGIIVGAVLVIGYFDWFYFLSDIVEKKTTLEKKLEEVQDKVAELEKKALQFNKYKAEVATLRQNYTLALQKLPDQREIPGLFHSVAQAGKDAGVDFVLFEPKAAIPKGVDKPEKMSSMMKPSDQRQQAQAAAPPPGKPGEKAAKQEPEIFYEEIPVNVTVIGNFPNIVFFFEKVARLPRIVNISDINMGDRKDVKGKGMVLSTSCTIKTYMFVDKKNP